MVLILLTLFHIWFFFLCMYVIYVAHHQHMCKGNEAIYLFFTLSVITIDVVNWNAHCIFRFFFLALIHAEQYSMSLTLKAQPTSSSYIVKLITDHQICDEFQIIKVLLIHNSPIFHSERMYWGFLFSFSLSGLKARKQSCHYVMLWLCILVNCEALSMEREREEWRRIMMELK